MSIIWFMDGVKHEGAEPPPGFQEQSPSKAIPSPEGSGNRFCVSALMTTALLTAEENDSCEEALIALEEEDFHHLPVTDGEGRLVGIVSDRDLLQNRAAKVGELMTKRVLTATLEADLQEVAQHLTEERVHCLVVVNEQLEPIGIVTSFDILTYLVKHPTFELWNR